MKDWTPTQPRTDDNDQTAAQDDSMSGESGGRLRQLFTSDPKVIEKEMIDFEARGMSGDKREKRVPRMDAKWQQMTRCDEGSNNLNDDRCFDDEMSMAVSQAVNVSSPLGGRSVQRQVETRGQGLREHAGHNDARGNQQHLRGKSCRVQGGSSKLRYVDVRCDVSVHACLGG